MDDFHGDGASQEARFFLVRVKVNPFFLFMHVKSLCGIVFDKYSSRYLSRLRGRHRGTKATPSWLKKIKLTTQESAGLSELAARIPVFETGKTFSRQEPVSAAYDISADPENYLAQYRWSHLLDGLLTQKSGWVLPEDVMQFISAPLPKSDAAWETYSTCERMANLLAWMACVPVDKRTTVYSDSFISFLDDSLKWVSKHLEFYKKKTGNHLLNNARALIMGGTVLNKPEAIETGIAILRRMLPVLIQPNGSLRERSSHYQLIVLTWLLDAYSYLKISQRYSDYELEFLVSIITPMCDTASLFCDAEGYLQTCIGDISPDLSPLKTTQRLLTCYPEWWPVKKTGALKMLSRDDWWIQQTQNNKIILNSPEGRYPKRFPSHAHNDISSFVWLHKDREIFIDSGRARYTKDSISSRQKSARGHSLPLVNGFSPLCESFVVNGNWWPTPYASAMIFVDALSDIIVRIAHDGFARATPVKQYQRVLMLGEDQVQVCDIFSGKGKVKIDVLWQLNPDFIFTNNTPHIAVLDDLQLELDLKNLTVTPQIHFIHAADKKNWYSNQYGVAKPNPTLILSWTVDLPFTAEITFKVKPCAA
jgi:hypothetical protein